ncbi:MAG: botulinum neurotoxin N-terminal receptor binding domain-containing protein [Kiritimatiellae bacterium]|nr:botulinum neurotoxin N-terminal receptor binding domain-containing protein [Kiritimatiellia bacterium]MDD5522044.1 botulinum neurotoxin N-terminal receptor binding domain-containing protein [Kiritimatiellia bacterium]
MRNTRVVLQVTAVITLLAISTVPAMAEAPVLSCPFDGELKDVSGIAPVEAREVKFVEGHQGRAALVQRPAVLTYPTTNFNLNQFTISFWVRHEKALEDYFFQQLVYFYHETPDMKNRIGILKRSGTNGFVFFFSDDQGKAKGVNFADNWFAMATVPQAWAAGSWHHVVCTADKSRGLAQFFIDDQKVAEARGTQFPAKLGKVFWVGTEQGHSWMRGAIDELVIEPVARLNDTPLAPALAKPSAPLPPARPVLGKSVGQLTGKDLAINLDFFDICIGTDCWDLRHCDEEMDRLMALCAHFGFDRIYFRVSVCGTECYHTKVMTPAFEEVFKEYTKEGLDTCCANIPSLHGRMAAVMRAIDPLASCVKHAHKHGMKVYTEVTIFDSLYYAPPTEFFQKHPEYTWVSRDGKKHIPGVPCYAYPEVRKYRVDQMKELCGYGIDGIRLCPRSHSPWPGRKAGGGNEGSRGYGFNDPVVKEYVRRYGKDPREAKTDSLDELRFVQLKGDFLTQFLREVKEVTAAAGKKLTLTIDRNMADAVAVNWTYIDADTAARERIVDELCVMGSAAANLNHWRLLADGNIRLTTWAGIHGETYDRCLKLMQQQFRSMLDNPTSDGSTYHELANLIYPDCWEEAILDTFKEWQAAKK